MLSRLLVGARMSIGVSLAASLLSFSIGIPLGFVAAIFGGWIDTVLSRIVDTIMCVPVLISALVVLQALGSSLPVLIVTIALLDSTRVFRLARVVAQGVNVMEYAETARLRGEGLGWMIFREILPNALPPLIAEFGLRFCFTFLFVAGLSFLGLGIQPPYADWGGMVKDNQQGILYGLYAPLYPAAAIALLTVGVNLVVDWLLAGRTTVQGEGR
jgi:peptide/nickel transport system permease protein